MKPLAKKIERAQIEDQDNFIETSHTGTEVEPSLLPITPSVVESASEYSSYEKDVKRKTTRKTKRTFSVNGTKKKQYTKTRKETKRTMSNPEEVSLVHQKNIMLKQFGNVISSGVRMQ